MKFYTQVSLLMLTVAVGLGGCNSAMQAYKKGIRHFDAGEYNLALGQFDKASKGQIDPARLNYFTAESYRLSNRIAESVPFYQKAIDAGVGAVSSPDVTTKVAGISDAAVSDVRLNYGYALKAQGNYS